MSRWHRVFGGSDAVPDPSALVQHIRGPFGTEPTVRIRGDDDGWYAAEVLLPGTRTPWRLDRYLVTEVGIRNELNTWAAWVETVEGNPNQGRLMQHLIGTRQVFAFELEIGDLDPIAEIDRWCHRLCRFLARETEGVYQIDEEGFFDADGGLLIPEQ
jgi:hypothetical protein